MPPAITEPRSAVIPGRDGQNFFSQRFPPLFLRVWNSLSLRWKVFILTGLVFIALLGLVNAIAVRVVSQGFEHLEEQRIVENLQRGQNAILENIEQLNIIAGDWATWDDTYRFISDHNSEYIDSNLQVETLQTLKIDLMAFVDQEKKPVHLAAVEPGRERFQPFPAALLEQLQREGPLTASSTVGSGVTGLVNLPKGILLYASRPILTSKGEGPIRGAVIFGRYLTAGEVQRLSEVTQLSIGTFPVSEPDLGPELFTIRQRLLAQDDPVIVFESAEEIKSYALLKDIYGAPVLILSVSTARPIYAEAVDTLKFFSYLLWGIGALFFLNAQRLITRLLHSRFLQIENAQRIRFQAMLLDAVGQIVIATDLDGNLIYWNQMAETLSGWQAAEALGKPVLPLIVAEESLSVALDAMDRVRDGESWNGELSIKRRDGGQIPMLVSGSPVYSEKGELIGLSAIGADITERKQREIENARLFASIQDHSQMMAQLVPLSEGLNRLHTVDEVARAIGRGAMALGKAGRVAVFMNHADQDAESLWSEGVSEEYIRWATRHASNMFKTSNGNKASIFALANINRLSEGNDPRIMAEREGIQAALIGGLIYEDRINAAVACFYDQPREWSEAEHEVLESFFRQAAVALENTRLSEEIQESYLETVLALAKTMDVRDSYTADHSANLAKWAGGIAQKLGFKPAEIQTMLWAAQLHDIGKIGIPDAILRKPGPLDAEEWEVMRRHPELGAEILAPVKKLKEVAPIVRAHHEKYDGSGYPSGLSGEQIPLGARILAVADAYGAMTDERVYRAAKSHAEAVAELQRCAGAHFDPQIVEIFVDLVEPEVILLPAPAAMSAV